MERLTERDENGNVHFINYIRDKDIIPDRIAAYEDTGLTPEEINELQEKHEALLDGANNAYGMYREYKDAEEQGLLIKLPEIKLYKTLYWIWGNEIMPVKYMGIHHGCVDEFKKYHVVCRMHTKKDRTFIHGKKSFTYKTGDERYFYVDDIGKTVFLTREEAEEALKGGSL